MNIWRSVRRPLAAAARPGPARAQGQVAALAAAALPRPGGADVRRTADRDRGRARSPLPRRPGGRRGQSGIDTGNVGDLDTDRRRLRRRRDPLRGRHLPADLHGRLGRHPGPPGSAPAGLHPPAVDVDRLLHPAQPRRPDLPHDQRHRGAQPARHQRRRDDLLQHPDPGRRRRHPARPRRAAGAGRLPHLPAAADRQRDLPRRLRTAPTARPASGSRRSPPTCRRASAASASSAASARSRATSTR